MSEVKDSKTWIFTEQMKRDIEEQNKILPYNKPKSIKQWQEEIHTLAKEKGWYDPSKKRSTGEIYMLIASEAFEAFEDFRNEKPTKYYEGDKPCGEAIEMADIVLRVMDYCEYRGWSLEDLIQEKHNFNKTRSYRHNGKKL